MTLSDKRREAGKRGGLAPHQARGLQTATAEVREKVSKRGVRAARKARKSRSEQDRLRAKITAKLGRVAGLVIEPEGSTQEIGV